MTLTRPAIHRRLLAVMVAALFGITLGVNPVAPPAADAALNVHVGVRVVHLVQRQVGVPYVWGGTTPRGFDCSGLTQYILRQAHKRIPRTAQQQYRATIRIKRAYARPGDLVFFYSGHNVYHVGIYSGRGYMYHAPRTGKRVQRVRIWTTHVLFGRVR